jgi:Cu2+-exporting ATPase
VQAVDQAENETLADHQDLATMVRSPLAAPRQRPPAAVISCAHCGLPVPAGRKRPFCCAGCEAVHDCLQDAGLARFYALGGGRGRPIGARPQPLAHDWIAEHERAGARPDGTVALDLDVQGIHCAACVWLLQELWRRQPGARFLDLNPALGRARLVYEPARDTLPAFLGAVERLGYRLAPASKRDADPLRGLRMRLGICIALALNVMSFALPRYLGLEAGAALTALFDGLSFALATVALLVGGPVFFAGALAGLRQRILHLDLPISLGLLLAWSSSALGYASGRGAGYFDTLSVFVALMLLGRFLQQHALQRNRTFLLANDGAEHLRARRIGARGVEPVPITQLAAGERLLLAPGDLVPARGTLAQASTFSLEWIDGESAPRDFAAGDRVPAGAFHQGNAPVELRIEAGPAESGLLRLLASPADDRESAHAGARFWAAVNRGYVATVLALAAAAAALWLWLDAARALDVATAVLVVTCPCALGLATPLAFDLALARLRRRGIYVRTLALLEKARAVRRVLFDKTGTLTWGGLRAVTLRAPPAELRDVLLTMVSGSNHPVSRAIADELAGEGFRFVPELRVEEIVGEGLRATHGGAHLRLAAAADDVCALSRDGATVAAFRIEESVRDGFRGEIDALQRDGFTVELLSGDRQERAERVAAAVGIAREHAHGGLSAEQKAAHVAAGGAEHTLMVGDGLNDAAAFEAAACAGTPALDRPVMPSRADFYFTGTGAGAVRAVLATAHRLRHVVVHNLWRAGAYNVAAVGLALAGHMSPLLCAVLMPASSLALIATTAWSLRSRPEARR